MGDAAPSWGKGKGKETYQTAFSKGKGKEQSWGKGKEQSWGKGGKASTPYGKGGYGGDKGWGKGTKGKRKTDPETTAWIGGLPEGEASVDRNKALQEHLSQAGDCRFVRIGVSGTGSAKFTSKEEVENAIATLNASEFQGSIIEVDYWTKKDDA